MKKYLVKVFDDRDLRGEEVNTFETEFEAQECIKRLEANRDQILNSENPESIKSHYRNLRWEIVNLA